MFSKVVFSSGRKRSKIFSSALLFSYRFHLSTLLTLDNGVTNVCQNFPTLSKSSFPKLFLFIDPHSCVFNSFLRPDVIVFENLRFHLSTLQPERFQNDAFSEVSTLQNVFVSVFERCNVDDRRKRMERRFQTKTQ